MATETLNIDDTVKSIKTGMETFLVHVLVGESVIKCPFLANPYFNKLLYELAEWGVNKILTKGEMLAFVLNNKVISLDKRDDYVEAVNKVESLPDDVDDQTWEEAEIEAANAFRNLVGLKN